MTFGKMMTSVLVIAVLMSIHSPVFSENLRQKYGSDDEAIEQELKWLKAEAMSTMVVTANRAETPMAKVTKSISVVSRKDAEDAQEYFFPEMIDNIPGVFFKRYGGVGQFSRIYVRGAKAPYAQFQYNGIPVKDTADMETTFQTFIQDLYLGTNQRVEVLRGTNSSLYGSQALSGVINIIPDKWNKGTKFELRNELGEHGTVIENARLAYGQDRYYIDVNPMYMTTDGENNGDGDFYYRKKGGSAGAGIKLGEDMSLEFNTLFSENKAAMSAISPALDADGGLIAAQADKDKCHENRFFHSGLVFNHRLSSLWSYTVKGAYSDSRRDYTYSAVSENRSVYSGTDTYFEMQHDIHPAKWFTIIMGLDYEKSDYDEQQPLDAYSGKYDPVHFKYDWDMWDAFADLRFFFLDESLIFSMGGRYNDHEKFDPKAVWEASAAYLFKKSGTKIHAHIGTGYRTPSFYQVYGGYLMNGQFITIGNQELTPEESISYEIGLDQFFWDDRVHIGVTYFRIDFDNLISYDFFSNKYKNTGESESEGIETYISVKPCRYFKASLAYTYADPKDKDSVTGEWSGRDGFPRNKMNFTATFYPIEKLTVFCRLRWMDERTVPLYDPNFNSVRWKEDGAATTDLAAAYRISEHIDIWARAENLFDKNYTQDGWIMPGRSLYGGVRFAF